MLLHNISREPSSKLVYDLRNLLQEVQEKILKRIKVGQEVNRIEPGRTLIGCYGKVGKWRRKDKTRGEFGRFFLVHFIWQIWFFRLGFTRFGLK